MKSRTWASAPTFISSKRFIFRVEYKHHTVLTSRDDNEEIDEWIAGFSVFL